ncbi:glutamyl-tRNA(Gln) amidotransferase subunit B, chloroplastic/mitochondrial-like [Physcomitrium patens]|uniref:glutamyl-tRNA(Gln) amidotransferase subunit B, chloroplastic/mitochondrial-like n=1 Tax=Physcomitrium patens TaxID=3218 RepID=UPI003CCD8284
MHTEDYRNFPKPVIIFSQRYMDTTKDNSSELPVGKRQRYETLGHSLQGKLVLANDVDITVV